jgi:hypothetical protein
MTSPMNIMIVMETMMMLIIKIGSYCYCVLFFLKGIWCSDVGSCDVRPAAVPGSHKHRSSSLRQVWGQVGQAREVHR